MDQEVGSVNGIVAEEQSYKIKLSLNWSLVEDVLGCFKIFTYDRLNSASNSFGARYHAIFKYVIFLLYDKSKGSLKWPPTL